MAAAAAVTVLLPPRIPTATNVTRCSALPSLPPRVSNTKTTLFSPSLNNFSGTLSFPSFSFSLFVILHV